MTIEEMVVAVQKRTHQTDKRKILIELKDAIQWAFHRIYNSENGPDILSSFDEEISIGQRTRELDLGENLTYPFVGFKQVWIKLPSDINFTPAVYADSNTLDFSNQDSETFGDTTIVAAGHPVLYDVINFETARFAPALPAGSTVRVDYFRSSVFPAFDESESSDADNNALKIDLPEPFHSAIVAKTTAQVFDLLDDDRAGNWEGRASSFLVDALYVAQRRKQGPTTITPFRRTRRRFI